MKRAHYSQSKQKLVLEGCPSALRPATREDLQRVRNMKGEIVTDAENPGLRVEPNFLDEAEEESLAQQLRAATGCNFSQNHSSLYICMYMFT